MIRAPETAVVERGPALRAGAALLAGLVLLLFAGLGLALGGGPGAPASPAMAAGDGAVLRHVLVLRDGMRPVLAAETGDRSLAANAPPPKALTPDGVVSGRSAGRSGLRSAIADRPVRPTTAAAFEARAPPAPAA